MRKVNSIKNFITKLFPFIIIAILGFIRLDLFLDSLGEEIYALNQIFFQFFAYITIIDAGVGSFVVQKYYKLFIIDDKKSIANVFASSKKALKKLAFFMLGIGILMSFFLGFFTNNNLSLLYMQFVFMLFLIKNLIDYFMIAPRLLIEGDQKIYKINLRMNFIKILETILEIIFLMLGFDYILILLFTIVTRFLTNYLTNLKVYREYPWLKKEKANNSNEIKVSNMKDLFSYKISGAIYNNVDIILISAFLSPVMVTIYASYNYIIKFVGDIVYMISSSISASMGNVIYKEKKDDSFLIFEELNSVFLFLAIFCSLSFYVFVNKFIIIWIGENYLISNNILILMTFLLFYNIIKRPILTIIYATAKYKETKKIVFAEAFLNLLFSLILIRFLGIAGVILATLISSGITTFIFMPKFVYNKIFDREVLNYFIKIFCSFLIFIILSYIFKNFIIFLDYNNVLQLVIIFIVYVLIILITVFVLNCLCFKEFRRIVLKLLNLLKKYKGVVKK